MTLAPGARIGAYEITSAIGAGGMGEVYRARDTRLKRNVALKILPLSVASDRDRIARFQREAELLAALNHPNIANIFGVEEAGGAADTRLVMELVDGEDPRPRAVGRHAGGHHETTEHRRLRIRTRLFQRVRREKNRPTNLALCPIRASGLHARNCVSGLARRA